jgi:hypothetical protein
MNVGGRGGGLISSNIPVFAWRRYAMLEYELAQLVEARLHKLQGRWFYFRWGHWNFALT